VANVARVAGPLFVGGAIYLFFRPREAHFVAWLGSFTGAVRAIRSVSVPIGAAIPTWILGVAPDLAWAMALGALLAIVWRKQPRGVATAWFVAGLLGTLAYELGQRWHLVPGTFDPLDVAAQTVGYAAGWWLGSFRTSPSSGTT
jgi:hypothetical protein